MKKLLFIVLCIVSASFVVGASGQMTLLTVAEGEGRSVGGTADLFLEVKPGSGRIFIDSFPLTKLDTQISTRFANRIACKQFELDCDNYDFFYTIQADSSIVGGPSAGAPAAVLTAAVMKDLPFNESVSMTGTINSGGIIGPVGGTYAKVAAAQEQGITKVIVPKWVSFNESRFVNETGQELRIDVVRAADIGEAMFHFTGEQFNGAVGDIEVSGAYREKMRDVANLLCDRTASIREDVRRAGGNASVGNFTQRTERAFNASNFYTAASYCFSENVDLRGELYSQQPRRSLTSTVENVSQAIMQLDEQISQQRLRTLSDLETYMVVKERILDARRSLEEFAVEDSDPETLAYITERYYSGVAWSEFFALDGKPFMIDQSYLRDACRQKISEAEERIDYLRTISPAAVGNTGEDLELAERYQEEEEYALCVFTTIRIKAQADTFLLAVTTESGDVSDVVSEKLEATKEVILDQQRNGLFPILGYSYYEYAEALRDENPSSALLYSQYALEMSNLDLYFPEQESTSVVDTLRSRFEQVSPRFISVFFVGLVAGIICTWLVMRRE